ncbi:MAG: hypothetical protein II400_09690, partial [Bacteroidaceae bacterium]|nr:hypothetical protein [Bacteroidaceae bacterium]
MFCILPHAYTLPNHEKMAKQSYKMNMIDGRRDNEFTDLKIYDLKIFVTYFTLHASHPTLHAPHFTL